MSCRERLDPFLQIWGLLNLSFVDAEASPLPVQTDGPARLECWLKTNITITGIAGSYQGSFNLCILYHKKIWESYFRSFWPNIRLFYIRNFFFENKEVENRHKENSTHNISKGDRNEVMQITTKGNLRESSFGKSRG